MNIHSNNNNNNNSNNNNIYPGSPLALAVFSGVPQKEILLNEMFSSTTLYLWKWKEMKVYYILAFTALLEFLLEIIILHSNKPQDYNTPDH